MCAVVDRDQVELELELGERETVRVRGMETDMDGRRGGDGERVGQRGVFQQPDILWEQRVAGGSATHSQRLRNSREPKEKKRSGDY